MCMSYGCVEIKYITIINFSSFQTINFILIRGNGKLIMSNDVSIRFYYVIFNKCSKA